MTNESLEAFMRIPRFSLPTPSPDGTHIAVFQIENGEASLRILDLAERADSGAKIPTAILKDRGIDRLLAD